MNATVSETVNASDVEPKDETVGYFAAAKELLNIGHSDENIITVQGRVCQENLIIPLAAFIEWAASTDTGHLALLFPTVPEAWSAVEGVEAFFSFRKPLISDINKRKREFYVGYKRFKVCSTRTKEEIDLDISGGMFIYRVQNSLKICEMYKRIAKSSIYKIVSVHSIDVIRCGRCRGPIESKVVRAISTPFFEPLSPRFFSLLMNMPPDEQEALRKMRESGGIGWSSDIQGLYWKINGHVR